MRKRLQTKHVRFCYHPDIFCKKGGYSYREHATNISHIILKLDMIKNSNLHHSLQFWMRSQFLISNMLN
jgi:hypothetical protein